MTLAVKKKENGKFTYDDYVTWPDEERWEIIDGIAYDMSPSPMVKHQRMSANLFRLIDGALQGTECLPLYAPIDVVLSENNIVQPDIIVVCDPQKITEKNIQGAPDMIVEILSPSTSQKDRWIKRKLYEKFHVLEYIIVDPDAQYVERYLLEDNSLFNRGEMFEAQQILQLKSVNNLEIPLWEVFEISPPEADT